jgi:prepilin-type processing-associated H-X9-DG protein
MEPESRRYELWGNGIAGINRSFSLDEFVNGQATLVAIDELRAGIHFVDPRGVWALGQIGGSITWGHGVASDAYGPNNQWPRSDDILGCRKLHETVATETLRRERMPCVDYIDVNQQATARSLHPGGVHVAFLDGSARFIADVIDPGLWHVIHSREMPAALLANDFDELLSVSNFTGEAAPTTAPQARIEPIEAGEEKWTNSVGMLFVRVPAGEFTMGIPDKGNGRDPPPECPAHRVRITHPFLLSVHEVTRRQFRDVMGSLPLQSEDVPPTANRQPAPQGATSDELPVVNVTWNDASAFCRLMSERPDEAGAGRRYRLPTEAEWERACRAGSEEPYRWLSPRSKGDVSGEAAGTLPPLPITPVGSYPANPFRLYDMRGNVWEWTADWFDRDYYIRSPSDDPRGPDHGYIKVVRGGDWRFIGEPCRIDYPMMPPWKSNPYVGFRVVCEITDPPTSGVAAAR